MNGTLSDADPPAVMSPVMYPNGQLEPLWRRLGRPKQLPAWLSEGWTCWLLPLRNARPWDLKVMW